MGFGIIADWGFVVGFFCLRCLRFGSEFDWFAAISRIEEQGCFYKNEGSR